MRRGALDSRSVRRAVMGVALMAAVGCSLLPFPGLRAEQSVVPSVSEGRTMDVEITVKLPDLEDGRQVAYNGPALGYNNDINMLVVGIFEHGSTTTPSFGYLFQGAVGANPDAQVLNVDTAPWVTVGTGAIQNLVGTVINSDFSAKSDDYRRYMIRNYGTGTGFQSGTTTTKFSNIPLADAGGLHRYLVFAAAYDAGSPEAVLLGYTEVNLALTSPVQPASDSVGFTMSGSLQLDLELNRDVLESPNVVSQAPVLTAFAPGAANVPVYVAVAAGWYHSLALKSDGTVWAWGRNDFGQLGDGTRTDRSRPVKVAGLSGITKIAAGGYHSLALKSDGTVRAWGANTYGMLGDGTVTDRITPVAVSNLTGATAVAAGAHHSLAIASDGTVRAWGANAEGELGDGTLTNRSAPVQVSGGDVVTRIAGGYYNSLALVSDGRILSWGLNDYGQLGDGSTSGRAAPVQVVATGVLSGITVTEVAAGDRHGMALGDDGRVFAWGLNAEGQLGDGTTTQRNAPVAVSTAGALDGVAVSAIAAGLSHSLAVGRGGKLYAWGRNDAGQVGDGTTTRRTVPVTVGDLGATAGSAGWVHSLAVLGDGTLRAWGNNNFGQLGDGTTTARAAPVEVDP